MAFAKGDLITATGLNSVNASAGRFTGTNPSGGDNIQDSIGNNGIFYSHVRSGGLLFHVRLDCGLFGGGHYKCVKWVNGGWNETVKDDGGSWNTHMDSYVYSTGPGKYRVYSTTAWQYDAAPWQAYFGQTDCTAGDFLVEWDNKFTSLNRKTGGSPLTAARLNSGYIGTTPTL